MSGQRAKSTTKKTKSCQKFWIASVKLDRLPKVNWLWRMRRATNRQHVTGERAQTKGKQAALWHADGQGGLAPPES